MKEDVVGSTFVLVETGTGRDKDGKKDALSSGYHLTLRQM